MAPSRSRCGAPSMSARIGVRAMTVTASMMGVAASLGACGDEPDRSVENYCRQVAADIAVIAAPVIAGTDDITAIIDVYRGIAAVAPIAVEPEWKLVIGSLEAADAVAPDDPASVAAVNEAALSGQPAYTRIQQYTLQTCGTAIGTPPTPTNPVTATTVAPEPDTTD